MSRSREASLIDYKGSWHLLAANFQFFFVKVFVISSTIIRFSDEFFTHVHSFRNRKILTFEGVNRCQEQSVGGEIFSKRAKNIGVKTCFENTDLAKQVA